MDMEIFTVCAQCTVAMSIGGQALHVEWHVRMVVRRMVPTKLTVNGY